MKLVAAPRPPLEVLSSIAAVDPAEWDSLTGGRVLASHAWLAANEMESVGHRYVLVRRNGVLTGAAAAAVARPSGCLPQPDHLLLGRLRAVTSRAGLSFLPALQAGAPIAPTDHLMGPDRHLALGVLEETARTERLPLLFPCVAEVEGNSLDLLARRGFARTLTHPVTHLDVEWDSFRGYLKSLKSFSSNAPRAVRHERNRFAASGLRIEEIHDVDACAPRLHTLAAEHFRRRNGIAFRYDDGFFARVKEALQDRCVVYGAFRGGMLLGFAMMLTGGGWGHVPFIGIADEAAREDFLYFNLGYYRAIEEAPARGLTRLWFGTLLYGAKVRRGCHLARAHLCYRGPTALRHAAGAGWIRLHRLWAERRKFAGLDVARLRRAAG